MPIQPSLRLPFIAGLLVGGSMLVGCTSSKDPASPSFDMSEYRKVMEAQKGQQGSLDDPAPSASEMTAEEHERAGDTDAQRQNFPLAGVHYGKALKADPTRNSVRLKLGQIFLQQGMFEPALTQFQDLQTRDPKSAPAQQGIGHVYLRQGKLREAEAALTKAIALDPSSWLSQNLLGLVYDQEQRHTEAIAAYQAALALRPREPGVLNNLGLAYALNGDHEAAIQAYEQAVATGAASPKLHNNLGVAYAHRQRYADALESFKKATDEPRAYNNLGVALLGLGNAKMAAVCFEKAIEANPQYYEKATENLRQARQVLGNSANGSSTPASTEGVSCP
ncbi:MAG TPA: tetratricopeptide repeat protein [Nitrospira sp.]|nr:tetratricopeptide repeat protein [Nitrospira sp.]